MPRMIARLSSVHIVRLRQLAFATGVPLFLA